MTGKDEAAAGRGRIEIHGIAKSYGDAVALQDVDLAAEPGEFISLLGPSGCGKTTLLRCIAGLIGVDRGRIEVDRRSLVEMVPWKRDISVVFQSYALFPHMSVAENVGFGLRMRGLDRATIARRVERALDLVQMAALAGRRPAQLSGGQQQRVALARAFVVEPTILLLDEPMAALDAKLRASVQLEIRSLQKRLGVTTILVTHDQAEAMTMSDRIAVMNKGRIEQIGTPFELYRNPATPFVADFIGETNRLHGECTADSGVLAFLWAGMTFAMPQAEIARAGRSTMVIRPENVSIEPRSADVDVGIAGTIVYVALTGDRYSVMLDVNGTSIRATILNTPSKGPVFVTGQRVSVRWGSEDAILFDGHV